MWVKAALAILGKLAAFGPYILAWMMGRRSQRAKQDKAELERLNEQIRIHTPGDRDTSRSLRNGKF